MVKKNFFKSLKKNNKTFIIAEAGSNHMQNISRAYKLIDIASRAGADAIKFQTYTADEIATTNKKYNIIKNKFKKYSSNLHSFYKKFEMPKSFYKKIIKHCNKKKIIFLTSVFGLDSFNFIKKHSPILKIASFEYNYYELLNEIIKNKLPFIVSTGCCNHKDILKLKNFFNKRKYNNFSILHCGSSYPLDFKDANLNYIKKLKKIFPNNIVGYSDHTLNISSCIAAVSLGARIIEKHFTISQKDGAPDSFFSLEEEQLKDMIKNIREVESSLGKEKKIISKKIKIMKKSTRSYYATSKFSKGTTIKEGMFKALRPYVKNSIKTDEFFDFVNKKLKKDIIKNDVLKKSHYK
jgi:N,N'-diacetyllegionaminate synthase